MQNLDVFCPECTMFGTDSDSQFAKNVPVSAFFDGLSVWTESVMKEALKVKNITSLALSFYLFVRNVFFLGETC